MNSGVEPQTVGTGSDDGWRVVFGDYDPKTETQREALFTLGNGVFTTRGASPFDEASEFHYPGTYRAGFYNRLTSHVEGQDLDDESLVNLPNWLSLTFRADGEGDWFSLENAEILDYRHELDLRCGITLRRLTVRDAKGRTTELQEERLVSMASAHLAAMRLRIVPVDWSGRLEIRSGIQGGVINDIVGRYAPFEKRHLDVLDLVELDPEGVALCVRATRSRREAAFAARLRVVKGEETGRHSEKTDETSIFEMIDCAAKAGEPLVLEKVAALHSSLDTASFEPLEAASLAIRRAGDFAAMLDAHVTAWGELWRRSGLHFGNPALSTVLRFNAFHVLQTISPHSEGLDIGIPARGWQEAYRGHIFWDDLFIFPFLDFRFPTLTRSLLLYRFNRLDEARERATEAGYRGAMFPWRSASSGREETRLLQFNPLTGEWTRDYTYLQRHIGAGIAFNIWRYFEATGDLHFLSEKGAEMIIEIARFWASFATYDEKDDRFDLLGVVGPDEYHTVYPGADEPGIDNNAYTNVMAVWTLCRALEVLDHLPENRRQELRRKLDLRDEEFELWERISTRMRLAFHDDGILSQFQGFEKLRSLPEDMENDPPSQRIDWVLQQRGENVQEFRVCKQADAVMLFWIFPADELREILKRLGYGFDEDQLRRTIEYYLDCTQHDSSLSRVVFAGALAQISVARSWELYGKALQTDLGELMPGSAREGIHLGAAAGALGLLFRHYLGIRVTENAVCFEPRLPPDLGAMRFDLQLRSHLIAIEVGSDALHIRSDIVSSADLQVHCGGIQSTLRPGDEIRCALVGPDDAACLDRDGRSIGKPSEPRRHTEA
ncbi:alpha,alpha-trehalase [Faunimonas pinastri]|uniref:Alpha,alpha-trehalase n=1 Tax=Faunimonas pinastri TaxID=1855383 RepID=A0A1H9FXP4_9HYPH|nr:glycosyl hydrolase family 65 protein [Faunimonas pinastri]SEQ42579.1 alpha,alpha-trehalase [Faunimonas pinastri]